MDSAPASGTAQAPAAAAPALCSAVLGCLHSVIKEVRGEALKFREQQGGRLGHLEEALEPVGPLQILATLTEPELL